MLNLRKLFHSALLAAAALFCAASLPLAGETLLVGNMNTPPNVYVTATATTWWSETFSTNANHYQLSTIYIRGYNADGTYTSLDAHGELWSDNSGAPLAKVADLGNAVYAGGTSGQPFLGFQPSTTVTLAASTTYHFVVYSNTTQNIGVLRHSTNSPPDAGSVGTYPTSWCMLSSSDSGSTWPSGFSAGDMYFEVDYVDGTVVSLNSFTAQGLTNQVNVAWSTGSEVDCAGFNVWRADQADGNFVKVNAALLPAKGTSVNGASYTWIDTNVSVGQTWYYKLEDVDTQGVGTFHGPVSATVGSTSAILSFQATPPSIFLGGSSLLNWTVNGTPALSLSGIGAVSGSSLSVAPVATTSYTLTDGQATSMATVTVRPFALKDLPGLSKAWGSAKGQAAYDPCYDLNSDGKVDDADVALCLK